MKYLPILAEHWDPAAFSKAAPYDQARYLATVAPGPYPRAIRERLQPFVEDLLDVELQPGEYREPTDLEYSCAFWRVYLATQGVVLDYLQSEVLPWAQIIQGPGEYDPFYDCAEEGA